ncbi:MAG: hypothetical protein AAGK67_12855 [Pseudomonadota bacterium]
MRRTEINGNGGVDGGADAHLATTGDRGNDQEHVPPLMPEYRT